MKLRPRPLKRAVFEVVVRLYPDTPGSYRYGVVVPALPGCFSDGRTREEALDNVREAIALHLAAIEEHGRSMLDLVEVQI